MHNIRIEIGIRIEIYLHTSNISSLFQVRPERS